LGAQPQRLQAGLEVTMLGVVLQFVGVDGLVTPTQCGQLFFSNRHLVQLVL